MQTWVLKTKHHTILIDTCNGNHKPRPYFPAADQLNTPYLERLKAAGCTPEDVDFVLCTHMHIDHVGWNTRLDNGRWVPTFPNAKYLFSRKEYEQYLPENYVDGKPPIFVDVFEDSVLPVIAAGQAQMVDGRYEVNDVDGNRAGAGPYAGALHRARGLGRGYGAICGRCDPPSDSDRGTAVEHGLLHGREIGGANASSNPGRLRGARASAGADAFRSTAHRACAARKGRRSGSCRGGNQPTKERRNATATITMANISQGAHEDFQIGRHLGGVKEAAASVAIGRCGIG